MVHHKIDHLLLSRICDRMNDFELWKQEYQGNCQTYTFIDPASRSHTEKLTMGKNTRNLRLI